MLIYLVRHGQTQANVEEVCSGHNETPLTEVGIQQAQAAGHTLQGISFDVVFSSDLSRAYDTAKCIIGDQDIVTTPLLRERYYHNYEGTNGAIKEHAEQLGLIPGRYRELGGNRPDHPIESNQEIIQRRNKFIEQYINGSYHQVLITSHGSFIRAIIVHILQLQLGDRGSSQYLHPMSNCAINIIEYKPEKGFRLVTYNQHTHILNLS